MYNLKYFNKHNIVKLELILIIIFIMVFTFGCEATKHDLEKETELEALKDEIYKEAYQAAYKEGYNDAVEDTLDRMPWYLIDNEELEDALKNIFDDDADEMRDQILSDCKLYEREDFRVNYDDLEK